ncbi:MAG: hypothetical protein LBQ46_09190 [Treponema sp.]|jgi:hypothetical protein|nr:hypothetical protein [Treponema sp.]
MINKKWKIPVIIFPGIAVILFACCIFLGIFNLRKYSSNLDLDKFVKNIEKYPAVERVVSIEENELDFLNTINIIVLLRNGGYIDIRNINVKLGCRKAFFMGIGPYHFYKDYYDSDLGCVIKGNIISVRTVEELLGTSLRSLKDVFENYYAILSMITKERMGSQGCLSPLLTKKKA